MTIDKEYLERKYQEVSVQKADALAMYHKYDGALQALAQLIEHSEKEEKDAIDIDEFAKAVGGEVELNG